ncbi:MAG TPA: glycosyltransferase 87 family protein [Streptosporangiaceae bacterium]|nr:glycosyltransferase 87 family protein [Streptosporangiaceae bacterium]
MSAKLRVTAIISLLLVLGSMVLLVAQPGLDPARLLPLALVVGAWIAFGCAAWLLRKVTLKLAVGLILVAGIALQVVAMTGPPRNSTDSYRYIWDGRVQAAGIDPYLYAPSDEGVARLRNDFLWSSTGPGHYVDCVLVNHVSKVDPADSLVAGCSKLNRIKAPTVYPPVAEAYFLAVQLAAPADDSAVPIQAAAASFAVLVTVILLFGLRRLGKDPRLAALWAWCPTVILECGQNAHVDVVAVALTLVALLLLARAKTEGRTVLGGVLLGLAIATKVTPVLVAPAVLRRGWLLISASAAAAISLVYAPHVLAVGSKIIGFFPGYLHQEGYSTGGGFSIIGLFVHGKAATVAAVVILAAIAVAIYRFCDPDQPWRGGVLMTSAALAVCTPDFQWYAILLVMLVALDGRPEWLAIAAGGYFTNNTNLYLAGIAIHHTRLWGYGGGAAVACACALARYVLERRAAGRVPAVLAGTRQVPQSAEAARAETADGETTSVRAAADRVLEPTAVYVNPAVSVSIGAGGTPAFAAEDAGAAEPAADLAGS